MTTAAAYAADLPTFKDVAAQTAVVPPAFAGASANSAVVCEPMNSDEVEPKRLRRQPEERQPQPNMSAARRARQKSRPIRRRARRAALIEISDWIVSSPNSLEIERARSGKPKGIPKILHVDSHAVHAIGDSIRSLGTMTGLRAGSIAS